LMKNIQEALAVQLEGEDLTDFGIVAEPSILANIEIQKSAHA
jgi:hypothetical protein